MDGVTLLSAALFALILYGCARLSQALVRLLLSRRRSGRRRRPGSSPEAGKK
jgi:hypothetical protein